MNRGRVQVITLAAIGCAVIMANFDNTLIMALPKIQASLGSHVLQLQWIVNAYTLSAASLVLTGGIIAKVYGHQRVLLAGLVIWTIAAVMCAIAPNSETLIVGRIVQGIGAAVVIPMSLFIFSNTAKSSWQKQQRLGLWMALSVLGLWAGNHVSGQLANALGWRSIFVVNVAIGAIALWGVTRHLKLEVVPRRRQKLNLAAITLSIIGLSLIALALRQGSNGVWQSPLWLWVAIVNGVSLIAFVAVEYRASALMRQARFVKTKVLASVNFVSSLSIVTVVSLLIVLNAWSPQVQAQTQSEGDAFPIYLLTPASDLVQAGFSNFELVFGRAGNDTIYPDDPINSRRQSVDVDFLFGDIFDNTPQEYEVILNIQNNQQGTNPLLILERDIPSVGQDRFVLGDFDRPYYTSPDPGTLVTTNFLGLNEYAVIYDFNPGQDTIQLNGRPQDYVLVDVNNLRVEGIQQPFFGKAIFSLQQGAPDGIAYIISRPEVTLDLNARYFRYVGTRPQGRPPARRRRISQLGTTGNDVSLATATDPTGNAYITGTTTGPLFAENQGATDVWIAKYNSSGSQLWGRQFGSSSGDSAQAIATDSQGNFYLAGETGGNLISAKRSQLVDLWVAKFDSNGNRLWGRQLGAGDFQGAGNLLNAAWGLDVDAAGNVYISGLAVKDNLNREIFDFNVEDDSWIIKFDTNGNRQWTYTIDTPFFNECYDVAVDSEGNSYITGWTQGLVRESDPIRELPKYDVWIAKVNSSGQPVWLQQIGSRDFGLEFAWAIDTDSQNFVYLTGWTTGDIGTTTGRRRQIGGRDIFLFKLNPTDGNLVWAKQFGSPNDDGMILSDMQIDAQNNIFLIGHTNGRVGSGQVDANYNFWVARFDTNGNSRWIRQFGSRQTLDYPSGVAIGNNGNLFVTGFTDGFLGNLGGVETFAVDAWLAQLNANTGILIRSIGRNITTGSETAAPTVLDVTDQLFTRDQLPAGDGVIRTTDGVEGVDVFSYGRLATSLARIFNPNQQNSFPAALRQQVRSGNIQL